MDEEGQILMKGNTNSIERDSSSSKLELSVDEVIENYVGPFGFSQMLHVFLVSLAWIFDSQNTLITIFTDAQPSAWKCTNLEGNCGNSDASVCGLTPGSWEWVGGNTSSTIAEWGLVCDRKFLAAIPASLFFLGSLVGSAVYGRLADAWLGRKKTILISCVLTSVTSFLTSLAPNIWIYSLIRCGNGFARSGIGICCLVLSTESVGRKWRGQVGQYGFFFFTFGFLSLPLVAYPSRTYWRNIYKIMSIFPMFYAIFLVPFVSESPRWLVVMGRNKEALEILKKFGRINGKKLPSDISLINPSKPILENDGEMIVSPNESLWSTSWAVKRMITVMIAGFGIGFVYYGIQLNVENLSFNLYFTVAVNAIMEIPAVLIGSLLLGFAKRRLIFSVSAYVAGFSCLVCMFFTNESGSWIQLGIEGIGFMAASTAFDVLYVYCVELFPTNVRNFAVSMLRQALMLGASIAPLLVVVGRVSPSLSFSVFGFLSIFSGVLSLWLPETRNAPLYETLSQQGEEEKLSCVGQNSGLELGL